MAHEDVFRATSGSIRNKYLCTLAVAERARQMLREAGGQPLEESAVMTALKELREGKLRIEILDEEVKKALEEHLEKMLP